MFCLICGKGENSAYMGGNSGRFSDFERKSIWERSDLSGQCSYNTVATAGFELFYGTLYKI